MQEGGRERPSSRTSHLPTSPTQPWYVLVPSARPSTLEVAHKVLARDVGKTHIDEHGKQVDSSGKVVKGPVGRGLLLLLLSLLLLLLLL